MIVKLYNKTTIPDSILKLLLIEAGKIAQARTSNVVVIVNPARHWHSCSRGMAHKCFAVARWALETRHYTKSSKRTKLVDGYVSTDGGYFTITLPLVYNSAINVTPKCCSQHEPLNRAGRFFEVAVHEWSHIRQYQTGYHFDRSLRAKRHDNRPWEREANKSMNKALDSLPDARQGAILALGLELERRLIEARAKATK